MSENTKQLLIAAIEKHSPKNALIVCKVTAVDGMSATLEPHTGAATFNKAALRAVLDGNNTGVIITPKVNSFVLAAVVNALTGTAQILQYSEVEKVEIKIADDYYFRLNADKTVELKCDSLQVLAGANGGVPIAQKVADKLAAIEGKVNALIQFAQTHTHPTPAGPSSPATPPFTEPQITPTTQAADLENPDFTH